MLWDAGHSPDSNWGGDGKSAYCSSSLSPGFFSARGDAGLGQPEQEGTCGEAGVWDSQLGPGLGMALSGCLKGKPSMRPLVLDQWNPDSRDPPGSRDPLP